MNDLIVEFECPQCGAPANLEETSRLFICEYCGIKSYLVPRDVFHYVLPSRAPEDKEIIYYPYWRFRGVAFYLSNRRIFGDPVDKVLQATPSDFFPVDLGFKTQLMKLRFTGPEIKGRIVEPTIPFGEASGYFEHQHTYQHTDFIGLVKIIYAPFYIHENILYDGISSNPVSMSWENPIVTNEEFMAKLPPASCLQQDVKFFPTLCPHCGWDMDCARDSYLLACRNCGAFNRPRWKGFKKLGVGFMPGDTETALYLPFWRIKAEIKGVPLETVADLIEFGKLTKGVQEDDKRRPFSFWIPAFQVGSKLYLEIAKHVTLCQPWGQFKKSVPNIPLYPVSLPASDATKILKHIVDFIAFRRVNDRKIYFFDITPKGSDLIFIPFRALGNEFIHPEYKVRVTRKTLEHFRSI